MNYQSLVNQIQNYWKYFFVDLKASYILTTTFKYTKNDAVLNQCAIYIYYLQYTVNYNFLGATVTVYIDISAVKLEHFKYLDNSY